MSGVPTSGDAHVAVLYVPCGNEGEAIAITRKLLELRLIACANIVQSRSLYLWEGSLNDSTEYVIFAKTTTDLAAEASAAAERLHSYEVPCVLHFADALASPGYASWVYQQVSAFDGAPHNV